MTLQGSIGVRHYGIDNDGLLAGLDGQQGGFETVLRVIGKAKLLCRGVILRTSKVAFAYFAAADLELRVQSGGDFRHNIDQRRRFPVLVIAQCFSAHTQMTREFFLRHSSAHSLTANLSSEFFLPAHIL